MMMDESNKRQKFSPPVFFKLLIIRMWAPILKIILKIDSFFPIFVPTFNRVCSVFKRVIAFHYWYFDESRSTLEDIYVWLYVIRRIIFFSIIFYACFYVWRLCNGAMIDPVFGIYRPNPLVYYFKAGPGFRTVVNMVEYLYMIERYAEPYCVFVTEPVPYKPRTTLLRLIYNSNRELLEWRPSRVPFTDAVNEVKRMYNHFKSNKAPIMPDIRRFLAFFYDYNLLAQTTMLLPEIKPITIYLNHYPAWVEKLYHKYPFGHYYESTVYFDFTEALNNYVRRFSPTTHVNAIVRLWPDFEEAWDLFVVYAKWIKEDGPKWLISLTPPDGWYVRHETYDNIGAYPYWDTIVHDPFRAVYKEYWTLPWNQYKRELKVYLENFFPAWPKWGPGMAPVKRLFKDLLESFWFAYLAPEATFRVFARFSDSLVLVYSFGNKLVLFISAIYGLPYLLVTYVFFFLSFGFTPLRIFVIESVMHFVEFVFGHFLELIGILETAWNNPFHEPSIGPVCHLLASFWMVFLIVPLFCIFIVLPIYLIIGFFYFLWRPLAFTYYFFVDIETETLRSRTEVFQICRDHYTIFYNLLIFRCAKIFYLLKSFFSRVHLHLPPIVFLPWRWHWSGVRASMPWWMFHEQTTAVVGKAELEQWKRDRLLIKEKGEEEYQKELDRRYWRAKKFFKNSWVHYSFIVNSLLSARQTFFIFSWFGHSFVFIFISFWLFGLYKHALYLRLFGDAFYANGLSPLYLGTAAYPKSTPLDSDLLDQRWELWIPIYDFELLFYDVFEQCSHIDHYAEFIIVISKWFLSYFYVILFASGAAMLFYRGVRFILMAYVSEMLTAFVAFAFGMGWGFYAFSANLLELDLLGLRGFLNSLMFLEEWAFDNYLSGYFADDLGVMELEKYLETHWKFNRDWADIYKYRNYHVRRFRKLYMKIYSPIEEILYPVGQFIETYRDIRWKEFLEKWEPEFKRFRVYWWNEDPDEPKEPTNKELRDMSLGIPKTGESSSSTVTTKKK